MCTSGGVASCKSDVGEDEDEDEDDCDVGVV